LRLGSGIAVVKRNEINFPHERTGGVPLFVEEVTRLLLERGEQGGIQAIPPTLQQSLMARLDRLGPAREVAQIGAVIGRGFSYLLLRAVAGTEHALLQTALERLAEADILLVQGLPPDSDYRFKHALIQDAAYENLLKSRRQALHRRVAETLRDRFADSATAEPEALAHHFTQAGMTDAAIEWWGKAGDQALRRSAFQEAISHLGKAIEMADKAEEDAPRAAPTPAAAEQRLKLQTVYANALIHARGHGAPETSAAFAKAQTLAAGLGEAADRFSAYYGRWVGSLNRCEPAIVQEAAAAFLRETELRPDSPEAGVAYRISGLTRLYFGDYAEARANIEKALAILKSERDRELAFRFGQDQVAAAMIYMALVLWPLGDVELARQFADQAASQAAKSGNLRTLAYVNYHLCLFEALRGDRERAVPVAKAVLDLAHERAMPIWESAGRLLHGWANWLVGDQRMELAEMRRGIERWRELD
jgi:predicted ATPase